MGAQVLIVSGGGDLVDPWHPFGRTSDEIAAALRESVGLEGTITVCSAVDVAIASLQEGCDLLVLNAGTAGLPHPRDEELMEAIGHHVDAGRGVLALHAAANLFPHQTRWEQLLGGRWVPGTSFHPPQGAVAVRMLRGAHPASSTVRDFTVHDEAYTDLRVSDGVVVLADHELDGRRHPLAWIAPGGAVVYDALGHDPSSYAEPGRRALLQREARWLLGARSDGGRHPGR